MNLEPKKVEYISLAFDDVAKIHNHSAFTPAKDEVIKDIRINLDDLGFRFHATGKRTISILNTFIPELMKDVLRESARQAEYDAYIVNNRRAVFESIKECLYQMSTDKNLFRFDLRSSELVELNSHDAYIKFGIITWDQNYKKDNFRADIMNMYRDFEEFKKTIYPDGAIVLDRVFDKFLTYYASIKDDEYYVAKISAIALEVEESRRVETVENYCLLISTISDSIKNNLQFKVEEVLSRIIKTA